MLYVMQLCRSRCVGRPQGLAWPRLELGHLKQYFLSVGTGH